MSEMKPLKGTPMTRAFPRTAGPAAVLTLLSLCLPLEATDAPAGLEARFTPDGRMTVTLDGWTLYEGPAAGDAPRVRFRPPGEKRNLFGYSGPSSSGETKPAETRFDAASKTAVQTFPWGRAQWQYVVKPDRLDLTITIRNDTEQVLWAADAEAFSLALPPGVRPARVSEATFFGQTIRPRRINSLTGPLVLPLEVGRRSLVACSPEAKRPLEIRWNAPRRRAAGPKGRHGDPVAQELADQQAAREKAGDDFPTDNWSLIVSAGGDRLVWHDRYTSRPIAPGTSDSYTVSLRAGSADDPVAPAADVCAAYADAHPMLLDWPDRRPILRTFIGDWLPHTPPLDEKPTKPEPVTPDEPFRERVLNSARRLVESMKSVDAQGMVIWNVEGSMVPRIKYVGSPEMIEYMCPEMDAVADEYFRIIREAGFTPGLCIRPTVLVPVRRENGELVWVHRFPQDETPVETLSREIAYAKERWGCKLFYIDTNSNHRMPRTEDEKAWWPKTADGRFKRYHVLMSAEQWQAIYRNHPDILLIPEHSYLLCYTATGPYDQMNMGNIAGSGVTPPVVLATWPEAFKCLTADTPLAKYWDRTVQCFAQGDVVMANAPAEDGGVPMRAARSEAEFLRQGPPDGLENMPKEELVALAARADAEPRARFFAARRLRTADGPLTPEEIRTLLAADDWLVRKAALDAVHAPEHLPLIPDLLAASAAGSRSLRYLAVDALSRLGTDAIGALRKAAFGDDRQLHRPAVQALGGMDDPKAVSTLMAVLRDNEAPHASRATAAQYLSRMKPGKEAQELVSALLVLLGDPHLQINAAGALTNLKDERILPALEEALKAERADDEPDKRFISVLERAVQTQQRMR